MVLSAGVSAVAGWLVWDRHRLCRRIAESVRRQEALEARYGAAIEEHHEFVAALEHDLSVAANVANWRAFHDDLTALPNRALLLDRLEQSLARRSGREGAVVVLVCDLDRFRTVNETVGRAVADSLLVQVADRLSSAVRPGDTVAGSAATSSWPWPRRPGSSGHSAPPSSSRPAASSNSGGSPIRSSGACR